MTLTQPNRKTGRLFSRFVNGNVVAAVCALLVFHAVSIASGKVTENDGLGWDGQAYAWMVTGEMTDGTPNTQMRPLLILAARVPYRLGLDVIQSFELLNYAYAFVLYLTVCLILERFGTASTLVKVAVAGNLALCIATSKMFGFYPVLIDLGALALTTLAFYLVATDRRWSAGVACVLGSLS